MKSLLVIFFAFLTVTKAQAIYIAPEIYESDIYDIKNYLAVANPAPTFAYMSCAIDRTRKLEFIVEKNTEIPGRADVILQKKFWNGKPTGDRAYVILNSKIQEQKHAFALIVDMDNASEGYAFLHIEEQETGLYVSYRGYLDINLKGTPDINTPKAIVETDCEVLR